jgi:DNA invertase Pin-like site-specific DNA recombinase
MSMAAMPLVPKNPAGPLKVVALGRISTVHQDLENIEASYRYLREYLGHIYQGPMQITLLGEQASGMLTDRTTIREAEELVTGGEIDLMIAEDLARFYRNPRHQYRFVQDCVDQGTRVICVGDNLDTADENWEVTMGAAALRHGLHIPDTRRRVRRTATHSFHRGGMVQKVRYGYRRLSVEEAAGGLFGPKDLRIARRPECTPVIRAMMERILRGDPYTAVAEWLEAEGIEPGPYVENGHWTARVVVELLDDPILSGTRTFRDTICRPIFKTGKHKPTKNAEPETEHCSELAHLTVEEHNTLRREIAKRRESVSRRDRQKSRQDVPRSRSFWPGQSAVCAVCRGTMYNMGPHLKCCNSLRGRGQSCWNHVEVSVVLVRERVLAWLLAYLEGTPLLRKALVEVVWQQLDAASGTTRRRRCGVTKEITSLQRQAANLTAAIAEGGQLQTLLQKLTEVEDALRKTRVTQAAQGESTSSQDNLPSKDEVEGNLSKVLLEQARDSYGFADLLRRVFPEFIIQPVQALDSGLVRPRGRIIFRPGALVVAAGDRTGGSVAMQDIPVTLDLFEPPIHIASLRACLAAKEAHPTLSLKGISALLGVSHMTVKRAFDYARLMERSGTDEPYREVQERPRQASRWRHRERSV